MRPAVGITVEMRQLPLPKRFPDAPFVGRTKVWTDDGGSVEAEGPYDDVAGHLLLMVAVHAHPKGKKLAAMKKCLKVLLEKS
jgi:hypothetical protein